MRREKKKLTIPEQEEKVLAFWEEQGIFERTLAKNKKKKLFVFYEGPPTANAAPAMHHLEARAFKDAIPRYKTMRGFFVPRKAGWDTHGLPVEIQIEKELGLKTKQEIEHYGIAAFNEKARASVWRHKEEWERFTRRIGFWLDLAHPYITYDARYMETLWWIIKEFWKKGLLKEDFKILPWCTRCQTGLSTHELAQGYRRVEDRSVYVRFRVVSDRGRWQHTSLLSWTTTPWTLPGNVGLAVNPDEHYVRIPDPDNKGFSLVVGVKTIPRLMEKKILPPGYSNPRLTANHTFLGRDLVGLRYEPIFSVAALVSDASYRVHPADFVAEEEGTGVVHTAVMYGEDDYALAKRQGLPTVHTVDETGRFMDFLDDALAGLYVKDPITEERLLAMLKQRGLLFREERYAHEYPFCWRCDTPILYFAKNAWWVAMTRVKRKLLENNRAIHWVPEHIGLGRFGEFLREVRDWAFSRERYWGTPLPIWKCDACEHTEVVGSRSELAEKLPPARNRYWVMRHGEALSNVRNVAAPRSGDFPLTRKGRRQVEQAALELQRLEIDTVFSSPIQRARESAEMVARSLRLPDALFDARLEEINIGVFEGKNPREYHQHFNAPLDKFSNPPPGGETLTDVRARVFAFLAELERRYENKKILIVAHEYSLWVLQQAAAGMTNEETIAPRDHPDADDFIGHAEVRELRYIQTPRDETGLVNLHRPYVDAITLACAECGKTMRRITEVADVWFDSGAMPFAQAHYPFEKKERLEFPADYIAEAVDQTRGWFYSLLAVATVLGKGTPYRNAISLGHLLDKNGQKMSKSKGNIVDPWQMIERYGADALRWYLYTINAPGDAKRFDERDVEKALRGFLMTLGNSFVLLDTYAGNIPRAANARAPRALLDQWIIARAREATRVVTASLDRYDVTSAARAIEELTVRDFSQWFLRRSRVRLQRPRNRQERDAVARASAWALLRISTLAAPFIPFLSEAIYQQLKKKMKLKEASIHLVLWPRERADTSRSDRELLQDMAAARALCSAALKLRADAGIKVRQPLRSLTIPKDRISKNKELCAIIQEEVNVKKIIAGSALALDIEISPDLRAEGMVREVVRNIQEMRRDLALRPSQKIRLQLCGSATEETIFRQYQKSIQRDAGVGSFVLGGKKVFDAEREIVLEQELLWIGLKR